MDADSMNTAGATRRTVLVAGVAAAGLAGTGCATYGQVKTTTTPPAAGSSGTATSGGPAAGIAKTTDVPVGGGIIVGDTVITQATAGAFAAFSAVCTHAGCTVNAVSDGLIKCPCHGSEFKLDGSVAKGPASSPLAGKQITAQGQELVLG